jgi:hypothetical protein
MVVKLVLIGAAMAATRLPRRRSEQKSGINVVSMSDVRQAIEPRMTTEVTLTASYVSQPLADA